MPEQGDPFDFSRESRAALENTNDELVVHAQETLSTQRRLRELLRVTRLVVEELELPDVLRSIVEAAVELVGARYGAIAVFAPGGSTIEQFIHIGMPADQVAAIGPLPHGLGLLGEILVTGRPVRSADIGADARSVGFPKHHPAMGVFLGVPIRVRDELFGNLYLARDDHEPFNAEDEELVVSLAATAAAVVDHARLFAETRRRQLWSAALADVTTALLSSDPEDGFGVIVDRVGSLTGADFACVVLADGGELRVAAARGAGADGADTVIGEALSAMGKRSLESGTVASGGLSAGQEEPGEGGFRWAAAIPLAATEKPVGVILLARGAEGARFGVEELDLVAEFAAQSSVAIEFARGRRDREALQRIEDRSRIARDLHDHVIQRLFAAGLVLQSFESAVPEALRSDFVDQVDAIDAAIAEIRTAVFALNNRPQDSRTTLRHRVLDVITEVAPMLQSPPSVAFDGAVDMLVPEELGDDIVAVVRESLTNVGRHARAASSSVRIGIDDGAVTVRVDDDGRGVHGAVRSSGTANLAARAAARGGHYVLDGRARGGTSMIWRVPLPGAVHA